MDCFEASCRVYTWTPQVQACIAAVGDIANYVDWQRGCCMYSDDTFISMIFSHL